VNSVSAIIDLGDVAVIVIGIAVAADLRSGTVTGSMGGYLGGGLAVIGLIGVCFRQDNSLALFRCLLGDLIGHSAVAVVGVGFGDTVGSDGSNPVILVVGVRGGQIGSVDALHQGQELVGIVIEVLDAVVVVLPGDGVLHQPVCEVIIVGGGSACAAVVDGGQCAAVVVLVGDGVPILPGLTQQAAIAVIAVAHMILVTVGQPLQIPVGILCIAVAGQSPAADGNIGSEGKVPIPKAVGGAGGLDGCQQVICVGIGGRQSAAGAGIRGGAGQAVHAVVGILRLGGLGVIGVANPFQHIGIGIVAVLRYIAKGIGIAQQAVTVIAIHRAGGDGVSTAHRGFRLLVFFLGGNFLVGVEGGIIVHADARIVAMIIISEEIGNACAGGSGQDIVVIVIGVFQFCPVGQGLADQVGAFFVIGIFRLLALDVYHGGDIAVIVIGIGLAKLLLIELNAVKIHIIDIVVVGKLNADRSVGRGRNDRRSRILPGNLAVDLRMELNRKAIDNLLILVSERLSLFIQPWQSIALAVQEGGDQAELPILLLVSEGSGVTLGPACQNEGIARDAADGYGLGDPVLSQGVP